jgi:2-methylcitrate dehydratase PrpD
MKCNAVLRRGQHPGARLGPSTTALSTALAAAKLMKLDPEKTRHAVNIAGGKLRGFPAGASRRLLFERRGFANAAAWSLCGLRAPE